MFSKMSVRDKLISLTYKTVISKQACSAGNIFMDVIDEGEEQVWS